jgi:hypothetical protein
VRESNSRLRRSDGKREPRVSYAIYCEGRVTERQYFLGLRRELRASNMQVLWVAGTPLEIVERALRDDRAAEADQIWCVFDVEAPTLHPNFDTALLKAEQSSIKCAISNPCFELWAILHLIEQTSYITSAQACKVLEAKLRSYTRKNKIVSYEELRPYLDLARSRAAALDRLYDDSVPVKRRNPSTAVWRLTDVLFESVAEES